MKEDRAVYESLLPPRVMEDIRALYCQCWKSETCQCDQVLLMKGKSVIFCFAFGSKSVLGYLQLGIKHISHLTAYCSEILHFRQYEGEPDFVALLLF